MSANSVAAINVSPPSRRSSRRYFENEKVAPDYLSEDIEPPSLIGEAPALMSVDQLLIHDDLLPIEACDEAQESTEQLAPRASTAQLSKDHGVQDIEPTIPDASLIEPRRLTNSLPLSPQLSARLQCSDIKMAMENVEKPSTGSVIESCSLASTGKPNSQLLRHHDVVSTSTLDYSSSSPTSRTSSPLKETLITTRVHGSKTPSGKLTLPARKLSYSPIQSLGDRITLYDNGALANRHSLLTQQHSGRLDLHRNVTSKAEIFFFKPAESMPRAKNGCDLNHGGAQELVTHQYGERPPSRSNSATIFSLATESGPPSSVPRFVPLINQWTYGQRVFGRYKKTPYFYSGNLATYLGGGMFMVVFDDGTLSYRVRQEDIMVRQRHNVSDGVVEKHWDEHGQDTSLARKQSEMLGAKGWSRSKGESLIDAKLRRKSQQRLHDESMNHSLDPSVAPEINLLPLQHVMVDFSVTPPREVVLSFDDNSIVVEAGLPSFESTSTNAGMGPFLVEDEALIMKRLDCGIAYEDDSTQVSDLGESSDEDMLMTPWQQMTQTFGINKATRVQRRTGCRSTMSSDSQVERRSITHIDRKQVLSTPKRLWQSIVGCYLRGNNKVQPTKVPKKLALAEHVRLMKAKLYTMYSIRCHAPSSAQKDGDSIRVVYERALDGIRTYGTVTRRVEDESYAVLTEENDSLTIQVVSQDKVELLPSLGELEQQLMDLERSQRVLFVGQKVQVSVHPGSRFSGRGIITLEQESQSTFNVLLANRIRLVNVPADKISPVYEKKKAAVTITEDQFLVCSGKVKVYIGDQIYVKCLADNDDLDSSGEIEKVGLLNGVYSNKTAAVDFADGSTGYEIPPHLIFKRKRLSLHADLDVRSLKNAVLMQASAVAHNGGRLSVPALEEGYQVKADHPRKATIESCVVIKAYSSSACDLRFSDGTIIFEVFPSQMIIDSVEHQRTQSQARLVTSKPFNLSHQMPEYAVDDYVLAWSSRFGRYCSAKIRAISFVDPVGTSESVSGVQALVASDMHPIASTNPMYTLVFDYGEQTTQVPLDKITLLDDTTALSYTQQLTNYSIDTMGFELSPITFTIGEAVMARVHGTARYFNGIVESVNEKDRVCVVCFDSSERDTAVPFSAMFSVDLRASLKGKGSSTCTKREHSSSSVATSRAQFLSRHRLVDDTKIALKRLRA